MDSLQHHLPGRDSEPQNTESAGRPSVRAAALLLLPAMEENLKPVAGFAFQSSHQHEHSQCSELFLSLSRSAELLKA